MKKNYKINFFLITLLLLTYIFINLLFINYVGSYAWDDGAITLAYGQTLADYGKFALTGASQIVEGSSSIILVFLSAIVTKLFDFEFYSLITWSQINTLVFSVITMILTFTIVERHFNNKNHALIIIFLVSLFPMFTSEIMNGMEMTMFSSLLLLFIISYDKKNTWAYVLIPLLLLIRFESIFYLGSIFLALLMFDKSNRNFVLKLLLTTTLSFIIFSLIRYSYFGDFMPNTIWAKMHAPYTPDDLLEKLNSKKEGGKTFIRTFNLLFAAIILSLVMKKNREKVIKDIRFWLFISFFAFAFISASSLDSGYKGRMFLAIVPIAVIFFVSQISKLSRFQIKISGKTREWVLNEKSKFYIIAAVLLTLVLTNISLMRENINVALTGGYYRQKPMPNFIYNKLHNRYSDRNSFSITPENFKITGTAVEVLRSILGLKTIKFMVPDVGGLGLCCDKINVIDSALLTNQYLAKEGYTKFETLLEKEKPDVIETHSTWSIATEIYKKKYFQVNYVPFIINENFFWLNKKHLPFLINSGRLKEITKLEIPKNTRYKGLAIDEEYLKIYDGNYYAIQSK